MRRPRLGGLTLALVLWAGSAAAQVVRVEAVGAVAVAPDAERRVMRQAALEAGLVEAVRRVALDEMGAEATDDGAPLTGALGADPFEYTSRYRVVEDYGERPRLLAPGAEGAETEYIVLVEAFVDAGLIRGRLVEAGLVAPRQRVVSSQSLQVVLEPAGSWQAMAWVREALVREAGAAWAVPVEIQRGRVVLEARTGLSGPQVRDRLLRAAPPNVEVRPGPATDGVLVLAVRWTPPPAH